MIVRHARELEEGDLIVVPYRRPRVRRVVAVLQEGGLVRLELSDGATWRAHVWQKVRCRL